MKSESLLIMIMVYPQPDQAVVRQRWWYLVFKI